ncbi:SPBc2 prophage-derived glycosyltransferase SunS [compost metagenome]
MKLLSVCMIVKDEEALLPRCLDSVRNIADEIIIVDTGSSDRTKEIAREYTDLIFDYEWSNDFAAARNESIRFATGKWVLVLDADEYLSADDGPKWLNFITQQTPKPGVGYTLTVVNYSGSSQRMDQISTAPVTRLFPNFMGIQFYRPIHEQLCVGEQNGRVYTQMTELCIYHTGYQEETIVKKNKHNRNMEIFERMQHQKDMSAYDWFTLGNQYRFTNDSVNAMEAYEKSFEGADETSAWYPYCLIALISLYIENDKLKDSWFLTEEKLSNFRSYPEYFTIKGAHYESFGFYEKAIECYRKAIEKADRNARFATTAWLVNPAYGYDVPVNQLIKLSFRLCRNEEAVYWLGKKLLRDKKNVNVLFSLFEWLSLNDNEQSIKRFLDANYDSQEMSDCLILFKVFLALGNHRMVNYYYDLLSDEVTLTDRDQLRYALINKNKEQWTESIRSLSSDIKKDSFLQRQLIIGCMIFKQKYKLELFESADFSGDNELLNALYNFVEKKEILSDDVIENYSTELFLLAKDLFLLGYYEEFDNLVNCTNHPKLINDVGNYFFSVNQMQDAMNYYSLLLSRQQLDDRSYENLAFYHEAQGYRDDALEFFAESLKLSPEKKHLYYPIIRISEPERRKSYFNKLVDNYPYVSDISFLMEMCNN